MKGQGTVKKQMEATQEQTDRPVGIFDSGVGGLTVLAALRKRLPDEDFLYLGDTARLPYGTKSVDAVTRYSLQAAKELMERRIKLLVVACNTATAAALPELKRACAPLPVIGVVEPGAEAACKTIQKNDGSGGHVVVLGTEVTIRGEAYTKAIHVHCPQTRVTGISCSLFVALAEEGWMRGPIAEAVAAQYLLPALREHGIPDCIVLGCTHFPPLASAVKVVLEGFQTVEPATLALSAGSLQHAASSHTRPTLVDSAETTAVAVEQELAAKKILCGRGNGGVSRFLTTDAPERFARVGSLFLGEPIGTSMLELVEF